MPFQEWARLGVYSIDCRGAESRGCGAVEASRADTCESDCSGKIFKSPSFVPGGLNIRQVVDLLEKFMASGSVPVTESDAQGLGPGVRHVAVVAGPVMGSCLNPGGAFGAVVAWNGCPAVAGRALGYVLGSW